MNLELRKFRESHGLTQRAISDKIGVSRIKYVKVELGYQPTDVNFIKKLSIAFNLNPKQVWQLFFASYSSETDTKRTSTESNSKLEPTGTEGK